jgi:lysophospholipase L1-like esterase
MIIPANSKIVLIGDSITDAGRDPCGESTPWGAPGFGNGYVSLISACLQVWAPEKRYRLINRGVSGHNVRDLAARWQTDVLDLQPDWLSVAIGVNDVWRQFDSPLRPEISVSPEDYTNTYRKLLEKTRPMLKGLILATPFVIEPNLADPMRVRMDEYGAIVRALATEFDAVFVDVQAAFDKICQEMHPMAIAWDRIHPGPAGHMVIARAWLESLSFRWE